MIDDVLSCKLVARSLFQPFSKVGKTNQKNQEKYYIKMVFHFYGYGENIITFLLYSSSFSKHFLSSLICNIINIRQNNKSYARDMKNFARLLTPQFATFTYIYDSFFFPLQLSLLYHIIKYVTSYNKRHPTPVERKV